MSSADWKETLAKIKVPPAESPGVHEDEFLSLDDVVTVKRDAMQRTVRRLVAELDELMREKRWEDALALVHPLDQAHPEIAASGMDAEVRSKAAFALGQVGRFDEAIEELKICVDREPDRFVHHSSLAYTAYNSLFAALNRELFLRGKPRQERIRLAHAHFRKAQALRPDGVTNFYREGMLFKQIEGKTMKAIPLFERAVGNWEQLEPGQRKERSQERKNYIKSLYQLASALLERGRADRALALLKKCIAEDENSGYLAQVYKYFALGKIQFQRNAYAEARAALEFAEQCEAERPLDFVYELLARTLLAMGDPQGAASVLTKVPERKRKPYYRWTEADVCCALGDFQGARMALLQSVERDRRSAHKALLRLARIEYLGADFRKARKYANAAKRFFHETWGGLLDEAVFWEALCAYRQGDLNHAREAATELKKTNPCYPKLDRLLGMLDSPRVKRGGAGTDEKS